MTTTTRSLGKGSLLGLSSNLEIRITRLCSKRKTKLFCKKHEELITTKFNAEHHCLKPKRIYENGEGKTIVIFCPHLMTLKGEPFYKEHESIIYESLEACYEIVTEFKHKPQRLQPLEKAKKESIFDRQARNVKKIIDAGKVLSGES